MYVQFATGALILLAPLVEALWPQPTSVSLGDSVSRLGQDVQFWRQFEKGQLSSASHALVEDAIGRAIGLINDGFVPWMLHAPGDSFEPVIDDSVKEIKKITLIQSETDGKSDDLDESYKLEMTLEEVVLTANHSVGLIHGLNTLSQLFYTHSDHKTVYTKFAPVLIYDSPAFKWRGLNLDVARSFIPVPQIKKLLDTMSWNKLNKLHLHVTDSQSWPLEIPSIPELSSKGAFHPSMIYSRAKFAQLQGYARDRGIEIVTEVDLPGHTASIHKAFPELITGYNIQAKKFNDSTLGDASLTAKDWSAYCAEPPCGQLKLNSPEVERFLEKLLNDLLPRISNYSSYFHAGGDEVNKNVYLLQDHLNTNDSVILQPLVSKMVLAVHDRIRQHGLTPIAWEEMLLDWNLTLHKDVIIQSWLGQSSVQKITELGYQVIAGSSSSTYLDCGKGQWLDFTPVAVPYQQSQGFVDYCSPFKNWKTIYTYDPLFNLTGTQKKLVLGFEVHVWTEQIDPVNLETAIWPRAAAAAEVGWSGSNNGSADRSLEDAGIRLSEWRERMVHRGVRSEPIHSIWCTQRPGQCSS